MTENNRIEYKRELINSIAIREAIINAVVHNDYSYGATPKLEFFSDRAEVTSMGGLPYGMTESDFFGGCSVPRNKEIMRVFRDLEIVEHLGSGVPRILKAYGREAFEIGEGFIRIVFRFAEAEGSQPDKQDGTKSGPSRDQVAASGTKLALSRHQVEILHQCLVPEGIKVLLERSGRSDRTKFRHQVIKPLIDHGWLEMTIPDKPRSSKQQYRTTSTGVVMLKNMDKGQ